MRFSLIHPSYGRPVMAKSTYDYWISFARAGYEVEYVLSLNQGDPSIEQYKQLFKEDMRTRIVSSAATNMVQATNVAAGMSFGEIIILMSDDMFPPWQWDEALWAEMGSDKEPVVLQVHDGIRNDIVTIPIMNRAAFNRLGYIYHPEYLSMFADNDLHETARIHGMLRFSDIRFEHKHYTVGKSENDATYKHENSSIKYQHGQRVFERRKRLGFPLT